MIKEDYCSYELSKLLKEKGFNDEVRTYYQFDDETKEAELIHDDRLDTPNLWCGDYVSAPTHQMAMKWLREEYNIFIDIRRSLNTYLYGAIIRKDPSCTFNKIPEQFETYEDAVEEALKYSLENLI